MQRARGKHTAEIVALARADGCNDPAIRNPDYLASRMLRPAYRLLLLPGLRRLVRARFERRVPGMFLYHQARTRYLDQALLSALPEVRQLVILGAGLDTRPYRFAGQLAGKRVFEVDHPGTAAWKQARLRHLDDPLPQVTYIAMDFNRDALDQRLAQSGYDPAIPTFFLWEGVVMYLPQAAVEATLDVINCAAPGSSVAFDYVYRASLDRPQTFYGAEGYQRYVERHGEPCRFGLDAHEIAAFLGRHGLSVVSNAGPRELAQLIPPGPVCDYFGIVHARRLR